MVVIEDRLFLPGGSAAVANIGEAMTPGSLGHAHHKLKGPTVSTAEHTFSTHFDWGTMSSRAKTLVLASVTGYSGVSKRQPASATSQTRTRAHGYGFTRVRVGVCRFTGLIMGKLRNSTLQ